MVPVLKLSVLVFWDSACWVASALERDISAQGDTPEEAVADLRYILGLELSICHDGEEFHGDEPLTWIKATPGLHAQWHCADPRAVESFCVAGVMFIFTIRVTPRVLDIPASH